MIPVSQRIRQTLVSLRVAQAVGTLDRTLGRPEKGGISAIKAIDELLVSITCTVDGRTREVGNIAPALLGICDPAFTVWRRPTYATIHRMVENPVYGGAYAKGQDLRGAEARCDRSANRQPPKATRRLAGAEARSA